VVSYSLDTFFKSKTYTGLDNIDRLRRGGYKKSLQKIFIAIALLKNHSNSRERHGVIIYEIHQFENVPKNTADQRSRREIFGEESGDADKYSSLATKDRPGRSADFHPPCGLKGVPLKFSNSVRWKIKG